MMKHGSGNGGDKKARAMAQRQEKEQADYRRMVAEQRLKPTAAPVPASLPRDMKLLVCARKRPLISKETEELDCVSTAGSLIRVHECGCKVDLTKVVTNHDYGFDCVFSEADSSDAVYVQAIRPLLPLVFDRGTLTIFAYGQTGSGKTFTMEGVQRAAIKDMFQMGKGFSYHASYFEIYDGKVYDLVNKRSQLTLLEDAEGKIQVRGLSETKTNSKEELMKFMDAGNKMRSTSQTTANDTSSRSHAICKIQIRKGEKTVLGNLLLIDLAGSEKAQLCQGNSRQRRLEGAEINKSLLALKECIRAIEKKGSHIPFRASKLTMVLRDSFTGSNEKSKIVMIACVNPAKSSAGDTINTLLYANRLKENKPVAARPAEPAAEVKVELMSADPQSEDAKLPDPEKPSDHVAAPADEKEQDWNRFMDTVMSEDRNSFYLLTAAEAVRRGQDRLLKAHEEYRKGNDKIKSEEDALAEKLQDMGQYEIDECVNEMEKLAQGRLALYQKLMEQVTKFRKKLHAEEESSKVLSQASEDKQI